MVIAKNMIMATPNDGKEQVVANVGPGTYRAVLQAMDANKKLIPGVTVSSNGFKVVAAPKTSNGGGGGNSGGGSSENNSGTNSTPTPTPEPTPDTFDTSLNIVSTKFATLGSGDIQVSDYESNYAVSSSTGRHYAYVTSVGNKKAVVLDGVTQQITFDSIGWLRFSKDGRRFGYKGISGGKESAVIDGVSSQPYDYVYSIEFSDDGKHAGYSVSSGNEGLAVLDGVEKKHYTNNPQVDGITFSEHSNHSGYQVFSDPSVVVKDDVEVVSAPHPEIVGGPIFNSDGSKYIYSHHTLTNNIAKEAFVVDGVTQKLYDEVANLFFKKDGGFAYIAKENNKKFVVIDGVEGSVKKNVVGSFAVSPDGGKVAFMADPTYPAAGAGEQCLIYNDVQQTCYSRLWNISFSPNSQNVSYRVKFEYEGKWAVKMNSTEGRKYDYVWEPTFSTDGVYVKYMARTGNDLWWIVEPVADFGN